ncbi:hypothetical protein ADK55_18475 [Streptomyces sp. WM4235]|uniref:hypothetical protein n=1 Tax=Streptomyces sp. WM4235 TaxID=1415551 RepID=UPI0006ADD76A|nr:hypothetical protein [Streptomyces sp. WM4235]KOU50535.1 hypothetical protein ADK55_18475 [Streptomyces sp. WM4235]
MDADTRLAEIAAREQAASQGPWTVESDHPSLTRWVVSEGGTLSANLGYLGNNNQDDARFIAAARDDIPWLLNVIKQLKAENQQLVIENDVLERALGIGEAA